MKKLIALGGAAVAPLLLSAVILTPKVFFVFGNVLAGFGTTLAAEEFKLIFATILGGVLGGPGNLFLAIFVAF